MHAHDKVSPFFNFSATIKKTYFARSKVKENQDLWLACLITKLVVPKLGKLAYTIAP